MNDLYLELAQSSLGKTVFDSLNLPKPPALQRDPEHALRPCHGLTLVAGLKPGRALKQVLGFATLDGLALHSLQLSTANKALAEQLYSTASSAKIKRVQLEEATPASYANLIFDATGLVDSLGLKALYSFFSETLTLLKADANIVILANRTSVQDAESLRIKSFNEALEGFVKSLAKELGKQGAKVNLLHLDAKSEKHLLGPLSFFTSPKSAYITGQSLSISEAAQSRKKLDWSQPLAGKVALVTGAAQGIGADTASVLARDGATVLCLDIPANESKLKKFAHSIDGHALALDLGQEQAAETLVQNIASQLGPIDIVVHNAGITRDKTLKRMPEHFWDQVIDINLDKIIAINELLLSKKLIQAKGRIVCVSSISGIAGNFGQTNYAFSKAAIASYVEHAGALMEQGITINAVAPGFIETDMTARIPALTRQVGRRTNAFGQGGLPLDVAEAIGFFCHPSAQGLNGNVLRVCGQSLLGR